MISPPGMALAALTVMLWILWSDTLRKRRSLPILYAVRIALFLIVTGVLIHNLIRYPALFSGGTRALTMLAAVVGIVGAVYFTRKLTSRS